MYKRQIFQDRLGKFHRVNYWKITTKIGQPRRKTEGFCPKCWFPLDRLSGFNHPIHMSCFPQLKTILMGSKDPQSDFYKVPRDILYIIIWNAFQIRVRKTI